MNANPPDPDSQDDLLNALTAADDTGMIDTKQATVQSEMIDQLPVRKH